jgi:cystathionine beta-lyase
MDQKIISDFDRLLSREGTYSEKYDARRRYFGKADVEPFWVADMDLPTPDFVIEALRRRLDHPMLGYTEQYDAVFDSIIRWMNERNGTAVEANWIALSPSVVTSICNAVQAFTDPGDSVAVLSPVYGPFFSCISVNDRETADCPLLVRDGRFRIDCPVLAEILERPEVKLLLLCNPQNPGGRVWEEHELRQLVECCAANGVTVFSDEIHSDIVYPPNRHASLLRIPGAEKIGLTAHSIGKTFNTSGLHASFVIIPDPQLRSRFRKSAERTHTGDINLLGKAAIEAALSPAGEEYRRQLVEYLRENTLQVSDRLRQLGIEVMVPEATFLVWSDFRKFGPWKEVFRRLVHEANVALSGGTFFGPAGEGWFRINCAHPRPLLLPAVERVVDVFSG